MRRTCVRPLTVLTRVRGCAHELRPAHRPRRFVPASGARRRSYARRLDDDLRGPCARVRRVPRSPGGTAAPGPALPPEAPLRPPEPGPSGLGRRPAPEPRLPRPPHGPPLPRQRGAAPQLRRPRLLPEPRPQQADVGALGRRRAQRRPLRDRLQDPSLPDRRRLRRRHHDRPLRRRAGARAERARPDVDRSPRTEGCRAARLGVDGARDPAHRAAPGRPSATPRPPPSARRPPRRDRGRRLHRRPRHGGARLPAQHRDRLPPTVRLGARRPRRPEADQGRARRHRQRRRARRRQRRARPLPAGARAPDRRARAAAR